MADNKTFFKPFLSLDLEMNQPSGNIIQVGVTLGKPAQSEEEYIVRQWLVSPGEPLSADITQLTGISEQDLAERAVSWETVGAELGALMREHEPFVNPVTWGGGDSTALKDAFRSHGVEFPFFGRRWVDVKTLHTFLSLARNKNPQGGLRSVMAGYGLKFVGEPHRADADAFNTLRLFFHLLERQRTLEGIVHLAKGV